MLFLICTVCYVLFTLYYVFRIITISGRLHQVEREISNFDKNRKPQGRYLSAGHFENKFLCLLPSLEANFEVLNEYIYIYWN